VFGEPARTPYDLKWRMFGIDVRVHPFFWIFTAALGWSWVHVHFGYLLLWVVVAFVSILIHELGHVFVGRYFGSYGHIVLYAFGGLAIGSSNVSSRWQRIAVSLAGPGAQLILLAVVLAVQRVVLRPAGGHGPSLILIATFHMLTFINLIWPLVNLLPIWPLDGGQITRELFQMRMPGTRGIRASLILSLVVACAGALFVLVGKRFEDPLDEWVVEHAPSDLLRWVVLQLLDTLFSLVTPYNAIFFGVFAVVAIMEMQRLGGGGGSGGSRGGYGTSEERLPWERDADWWKSGRDPWR
jgi:stage IV sporulation protein FB